VFFEGEPIYNLFSLYIQFRKWGNYLIMNRKKSEIKKINLNKLTVISISFLFLIAGFMVFLPQVNSEENSSITWNVTKEVYPTVIHPCEPATISINISADVPVAVMLVIDLSKSMNWEYVNDEQHSALYYVKNLYRSDGFNKRFYRNCQC